MIDERYLYEIHPHRPIKNLIPGRALIRPLSMKLTKSEVKTCIASGPVFRLFPGKDLIRVTGANLDKLHVSSYEEYLRASSTSNSTQNASESTRTSEPSRIEPKTEAPREVILEEKPVITETVKISEPVVEVIENLENNPIPIPLEPGPVIIEEPVKEEVEELPEVEEDIPVEDTVEDEAEEGSIDFEEELDTEEDESEEDEEVEETTETQTHQVSVNLSNPNGYRRRKHKKHQ